MLLTDTFYLTGEVTRLWIETNPETVSLDSNNVQKAPLSIRFWSGEGISKTELTAYLTLKVESVVGSSATTLYSYASPSAVSSYSYTIPSNSYPTANRISVYAYEDAARTKEIGSKQINIIVDNPIPYPRGEAWADDMVFKNGEMLLLDSVAYMWNSRVPGNSKVHPKTDIANTPNTTCWVSYQDWPLLCTNMMIARLALIGKAVFYDEFMFSQYGTDKAGSFSTAYHDFANGAFMPNLELNFLTGKLRAQVGEFGGFLSTTFANVESDWPTNIDLTSGMNLIGNCINKVVYLPKADKFPGANVNILVKGHFSDIVIPSQPLRSLSVEIEANGSFYNEIYSIFSRPKTVKLNGKMLRLVSIPSTKTDYKWYILNSSEFTNEEIVFEKLVIEK